jgi:hypothetical protein
MCTYINRLLLNNYKALYHDKICKIIVLIRSIQKSRLYPSKYPGFLLVLDRALVGYVLSPRIRDAGYSPTASLIVVIAFIGLIRFLTNA